MKFMLLRRISGLEVGNALLVSAGVEDNKIVAFMGMRRLIGGGRGWELSN